MLASSRLVSFARAIVPWVVALGALALLDPEIRPHAAGRTIEAPAPAAVPAPKKEEEVLFEPWEHVST